MRFGLRCWPALLSALLLAACSNLPGASFDTPEIELVGLAPVSSNSMEARFRVALRIVNPNDRPLAIRGMAYQVFLRERRVLSGVSSEPLDVGPFSETTTNLEVSAGVLGSLGLLRDLINDSPAEGLPYELRAKLSTGGLPATLRLSREGRITLETGATVR